MKHVLICAALSLFALAGTGAAAASAAPLSVDDLYTYEDISNFSISPDGRHLALGDNRGDSKRITVINLDTMKAVASTDAGDAEINWVRWATDQRLLVSLILTEDIFLPPDVYTENESGRRTRRMEDFKYTRLLSMNWDGSGGTPMLRGASEQLKSNYDLDGIVSILPSDPDHFLMPGRERGTNLYKVSLRDGSYEKIEDGNKRTFDYEVTREGYPVIRYDWAPYKRYIRIYARGPEEKKWKKVASLRREDLKDFDYLAPTDNPEEIYVSATPDGQNTAGVYRYNLVTKRFGERIGGDPKLDVYASVTDGDGEYLGAVYRDDRITYDFEDASLNAMMKGLASYFGREVDVRIVAANKDATRWILRTHGPKEPGAIYVYDAKRKKVDPVAPLHTRVKPAQLAAMQSVTYTASDGQTIKGYFTKGQGAGVRPLIVMPHGGPERRDYYSYEPWAQYFASRGYSVFQPNFRGSSGFGRKFAEAGYRQWGGRMQDDVTDGLDHLIKTGQADASKVCIVGASYGGYAALMGGVKTPDRYKCVVSINGVSDLRDMLKYERELHSRDSENFEYWEKSIGDERADRDALEAASPARQAGSMVAPVLLIHGEDDWIVPVEQAEAMRDALKGAGKTVEYLELPDTGHNLDGEDDDDWFGVRKTLETTAAFLARHLPAD